MSKLLFLVVCSVALSAAPAFAQCPGVLLDPNASQEAGTATISSSPLDIGAVRDVFDGDDATLARTAAINPGFIQLSYTQPRSVCSMRVLSSATDQSAWWVEAANTQADMDGHTGSYALIVPERAVIGNLNWDEFTFASPVTAKIFKLTVRRDAGDDYVHINEWQLFGNGLSLVMRPDGPVTLGTAMTWRAEVSGGSGNFSYAWSSGMGSTAVVTKEYPSIGFKTETVTVMDTVLGDQATASYSMFVLPTSYVEPPSVTPVLWVPRGVNPAPLVPQLERVWRSIRARFFELYGKTFKLQPLRTVVSTINEPELCGGDCADLRKADTIMGRAFGEASTAVGRIEYTREIQLMTWGAGAWAGSYSWDLALGGVGDYATSQAAGVQIPAIEPDLAEWLVQAMHSYKDGVNTIAHELNHGIGWDDPHDFSLDLPPTPFEILVSRAGPYLTDTLSDTTKPDVSIDSPAESAVLSGTITVTVTAGDAAMDAVVLLIDGKFWGVDESAPYTFTVDTTRLPFSSVVFTAIAYDETGNTTEATRNVSVKNIVSEAACGGDFPPGTFHTCYFDGRSFDTYLGTVLDPPFPVTAVNAGWGRRTGGWAAGEPFGKAGDVSAIWRGTLDFPPANYHFRFWTDDGLRVYIDGELMVDAWYDQIGQHEFVMRLSGPTPIHIEWYNGYGGQGMSFVYWQTAAALPGQVDLSVTQTDAPNPVNVGSNVTYTVAVTNNGPAAASNVSLADALPSPSTFVSITPSQGSCTGSGPVTCALGALNAGVTATVTVRVTVTGGSSVTNVATVSSTETDANLVNNTSTAHTTVNAPTGGSITVTAPNTDVTWVIGTTRTVKWTHTLGAASYVKVEASTNSGATWTTVAASVKNGATAGSFKWLIGGSFAPTPHARIRVSALAVPGAADTSDADFHLVPPEIATVPAPAAGANWGQGTTRTVTWTTNLGALEKVNVLLSTNGGATFPTVLASNVEASVKKAVVTVPAVSSATARIRVVWANPPGGLGASKDTANFTIAPAFISVTVPNGGETWTVGSQRKISWTHNLGKSENVMIELSRDGGATYTVTVLASTASDGSQTVSVRAGWVTGAARIRIKWVEVASVADSSNGSFLIQ